MQQVAKRGFFQHESYIYPTRFTELDKYEECWTNQVLQRVPYNIFCNFKKHPLSEILSQIFMYFVNKSFKSKKC